MPDQSSRQKDDIIRDAIVTELVMANRILAREDVIDDFGDIMEFTMDGDLVGEDHRRPYAERHIHGAIYRDRPDVNAVTHHHARSVLPFTMADVSLRPMFHMASVIGKEIKIWDSQDEFGDTNMLVDSMEMGHSLSRTLGNNRVALLRGHGCICAAADIRSVIMISIALKDNAALVQETRQLGEITYLTDGEIDKESRMLLSEMPLARAWDYWVARAGFHGL